ncbi:histidinol-phosphate transaminase [Ferrimonas lipolytica]|uniref:Histidinol-phosphate aminotransferase n=1 Tax=Ferrimonas lipolytica TaxID=2724191 RepID=A0A6H1UCG4_9GAMM|nr:histidinol-phosphate transaminase [Ferrimonas lipolytica]QIZ76751.1 histidinol-phosphate transaminase [Ferrimonas lipolytica]
MSLAHRLARPEIVALTPYASARREHSGGDLFLNANESPWNNSEIANCNRYPDCQPSELRRNYANYAGVVPEQVLITRGADEGIDLLFRTFCTPAQDAVGCLTPSYGMYAISAATNAVACAEIPWANGYQLPDDFAEQNQGHKLVFVCNPNNPTGTTISPLSIEQLAQQLPDSLLVVDEAYIEFSPSRTAVGLIERNPNIVVLRTLSKAFALAGARCGFVIADSDIIAMLEKVIAPYPVPEPVAQLASAATSPAGVATMQQQVAELNLQRQRFCDAIAAFTGVGRVINSEANFVLFECENSEEIQSILAKDGILIRRYRNHNLLGWLRASIGTAQQMESLLTALTKQLLMNKESV